MGNIFYTESIPSLEERNKRYWNNNINTTSDRDLNIFHTIKLLQSDIEFHYSNLKGPNREFAKRNLTNSLKEYARQVESLENLIKDRYY